MNMNDLDVRSKISNCVIVNKTIQHILPDIIKSLQDEVKRFGHYRNELTTDFLLTNLSENSVRKPFLRLPNGECPPMNIDAALRVQRNEQNLTDLRSVSTKRWLKTELISLIKAVAQRVHERQIQILEEQCESLLSKLARARQLESKNSIKKQGSLSLSSSEILSTLRDTELQLAQARSNPTHPPKWLCSALASMARIEMETLTLPGSQNPREYWEKNIAARYSNKRFIYSRAAQPWFDILAYADSILTPADWTEISVYHMNGSVDETNAKLTWLHRVRPDLNRSGWTDDEDAKLSALVQELGEQGKWEEIARRLNNSRTVFACFQRWQTVLNPNFQLHRVWSTDEDTALMDILKRLLDVYPPSTMDWEIVASYHPTRNPAECRIRALKICPIFKNVVFAAKPPEPAKTSTSIFQSCTNLNSPFTLQEDLQLLMAVQRYGIAGGRSGSGGGTGIGSWALVSTALPGRSVRVCIRRYLELCEQYQPWNYAEDRKLYEAYMRLGYFYCTVYNQKSISIHMFSNILPHFPGRSVLSLQNRLSTLRRWSKVWMALRQAMTGRFIFPGNLTSSHPTNTNRRNSRFVLPNPELRKVLLCSPFTAPFIDTLKSMGVPDPETEAYRLLITWKPKKNSLAITDKTIGPSTNQPSTSFSPPSSTDQIVKSDLSDWPQADREFLQLLDDLAEKSLVPSNIDQLQQIYAQNPIPSTSQTDPLGSISLNSDTYTRLSFQQAKVAIARSQLKQIMVAPVRRCLSVIARVARVQNKSSIKPCRLRSSAKSTSNVTGEQSSSSVANAQSSRASLLLREEPLFWSSFNKALEDPKIERVMARVHTVDDLRFFAPLLARVMMRLPHASLLSRLNAEYRKQLKRRQVYPIKGYLSGYQVVNTPIRPNQNITTEQSKLSESAQQSVDGIRKLKSTTEVTSTDLTTDEPNAVEQSNVRFTSFKGLPKSKLDKLIQIRRLLLLYGKVSCGRPINYYDLSTNIWPNSNKTLNDVCRLLKAKRHVPPILRGFPPDLTAALFVNPERPQSECRKIARACLVHALRLGFEQPSETTDSNSQPNAETTISSNSVNNNLVNTNILPPNYATLLGFKSLLLHIPLLLEKGSNILTQFVEMRQLFSAFPGQSFSITDFEERLKKLESSESISSTGLTVARTLLSPEYSHFISCGLSILLWPAILAGIPAQTFVEAGKRSWQQAFENIPPPISAFEYPVRSKRRRYFRSKGDSMKGVITRRSYPSRTSSTWLHSFAESRIKWAKKMNSSVTLFVETPAEDGDGSDQIVPITLPTSVKLLYASGFKPELIMHYKTDSETQP